MIEGLSFYHSTLMVRFNESIRQQKDKEDSPMSDAAKYMRDYRKKRKRIELTCSLKTYHTLVLVASEYGRPLSTLILDWALAYLEKGFVLPDDREVIALKNSMRRWGNNLNQIAHQANRENHIGLEQIRRATELVERLECDIDTIFNSPISIEEEIVKEAKRDPMLIPRLIALLQRLK